MVLVPANALDVIPRVGLMTAVALIDLHICTAWIARSIRFAGNRLINHFEMLHVVARRRLMTLRAVCRARRRVLELGDGPLRSRVALGAILPKELEMLVLIRMAACAVQDHLFGGDVLVPRLRPCAHAVLSDPAE